MTLNRSLKFDGFAKMERLLKVDDVARLLQVSKRTVYDWTHVEYIPHYKFSRGVRFKESEINRWLLRKRVKGRNEYQVEIDE